MRAAVITVSTRAAAGSYADASGPVLVQWLTNIGAEVAPPLVVPDGAAVGATLRAAVADNDVVLTTGGTGISPTDVTPEQTAGLLAQQLPGIAEALRSYGTANKVPTAMLSRGLAGVAVAPDGHRCLVINLPGSKGAVADAINVLDPVLPHALAQLGGSDHRRQP